MADGGRGDPGMTEPDLHGLRAALTRVAVPGVDARGALTVLRTHGLAHEFVRLGDQGPLARLPRFSLADLSPDAALAAEHAGYARAAPSGRVPAPLAVLPPSAGLPRGGLVLEAVPGRPPRLPDDLPAIAESLARVHALPPPPEAERPPLETDEAGLTSILDTVAARIPLFAQAGMAVSARALVEAELTALTAEAVTLSEPPLRLCLTDTHPGNFVVRPDGVAVMVDGEKARYGIPAIDLAHASLETSTLWDPDCAAALSPDAVGAFHRAYRAAARDLGQEDLVDALRAWLVPARRAVWLRTTSFLALFRVALAPRLPLRPEHARHIERLIDHAFDPQVMARIRASWADPEALTAGLWD